MNNSTKKTHIIKETNKMKKIKIRRHEKHIQRKCAKQSSNLQLNHLYYIIYYTKVTWYKMACLVKMQILL